MAPSLPKPRAGEQAGGARIPERGHAAWSSRAPLPLCSHRNASPFWIILLLVIGPADHGMIRDNSSLDGSDALSASKDLPLPVLSAEGASISDVDHRMVI